MEEIGDSDKKFNPEVTDKEVPEAKMPESFETADISNQEGLEQLTENLSEKLHNQGEEATGMGNKILEEEIKIMGGTEDDLSEGKALIRPFKEQIEKEIRQGEYEMQNVQAGEKEENKLEQAQQEPLNPEELKNEEVSEEENPEQKKTTTEGQEESYDEQVRKLQVESLEAIQEANKLQGIEQIKALRKIQSDRVRRLEELKKMKNPEEPIETETENLESENIEPDSESIESADESAEGGSLKGSEQAEKKEKLYPLATKQSKDQIEKPDGNNNQKQENKDNVIDAEFTAVKESPVAINEEVRISPQDQSFDVKIQEARDRVFKDDKQFEELKDEVKNMQSQVNEMLRSGDLEKAEELMKKQKELLDTMKNLQEMQEDEEDERLEEEAEEEEEEEEEEEKEESVADESEKKTYKEEPEKPREEKVKETEVQKQTSKWGQWGRAYIRNLNATDKEISKIPGKAVIGAVAGATPPLLRTAKLMVKELFSQIGRVTGGGEFFSKIKNTWKEVRGPQKSKE